MADPDRLGRAGAAGYIVRPMTRDDCEEMSRAHVQVWRETYGGLMRPEVLDALDPVAAAQWRREKADAGELKPTWLAIAPDGSVAGMASAGPSRDDDPPVPLELYAINILAAHHGSGVADVLVDAAVGAQPASLWVVDGNARAQAFYARLGFAPDGATKDDDDLLPGIREIRLVRR